MGSLSGSKGIWSFLAKESSMKCSAAPQKQGRILGGTWSPQTKESILYFMLSPVLRRSYIFWLYSINRAVDPQITSLPTIETQPWSQPAVFCLFFSSRQKKYNLNAWVSQEKLLKDYRMLKPDKGTCGHVPSIVTYPRNKDPLGRLDRPRLKEDCGLLVYPWCNKTVLHSKPPPKPCCSMLTLPPECRT